MSPNDPFPEQPLAPPPEMMPPDAVNYGAQQVVNAPPPVTAAPAGTATPPNAQTFTPSLAQNPNFVEQLTNIERKNQETLEIIAEGQRLILQEAKKRTSLERWRFWMGVLTKLVLIAVFALSFFFVQSLIQGMMDGLGGLGGGLFSNLEGMLNLGNPSVPVGPKPPGASAQDVQNLLQNPAIQNLLK